MTQKSVCRQTVTVNLENGLHLVPCSRIVRWVRRFDCDVQICNGDLAVNAKNVLDLMMLNAVHGTELVLEAHGDGALQAVDGLVRLFESDFETDEA